MRSRNFAVRFFFTIRPETSIFSWDMALVNQKMDGSRYLHYRFRNSLFGKIYFAIFGDVYYEPPIGANVTAISITRNRHT